MTLDTGGMTTHRAADLRYRFLRGPVSLEPLRILRCASIEAHGWSIRLAILGASHAVALERRGERLTELLTCLPPPLDAGGQCRFESAVTSSSERRALPAGLGVDGSFVTLGMFPLQSGDRFEESFETNCRLDLAFPFLGAKAPGADFPHTRIGWRVTASGLVVETIHTYPEDEIGVRSRTIFALNAAGGNEGDA